MLFMFQLLGVGLVGGAKTRFGREEEKIRRAPLTIFRSRTPFFIVRYCFFDNKALGRYETERDCTPYI